MFIDLINSVSLNLYTAAESPRFLILKSRASFISSKETLSVGLITNQLPFSCDQGENRQLPFLPPEENEEDKQEVTVSLAAAKDISMVAAGFLQDLMVFLH